MMKIVTSGVDSEYVLGGLSRYLKDCGWEVFEFDFGQFKGDVHNALGSLPEGPTAYITSAHANLTANVADILVPTFRRKYPNYWSPLEFIQKIQPDISIYIPHDLLSPFGESNLSEHRFLDLFDVILSPTNIPELQAVLGSKTHVIESGWIKTADMQKDSPSDSDTEPRITLFLSLVEWLLDRHGAHGLASYFAPLLVPGISVKLPAWSGIDKFEAILREEYCVNVIDSSVSSISVIKQSNIILCNGASSIHAEASLMGIPCVCLVTNEPWDAGEQIKRLSHLPALHFHDYTNRIPLSKATLIKLSKMRKHPDASCVQFNYSLVNELLEKARTHCQPTFV
jgi:hypothetical protein